MKTKNPSIAALTLISFLAASAASAQVSAPGATASGAVNSATQAATSVNAATVPAAVPPTPAQNAQNSAAISAQNAAAAQNAANTNIRTGTPVVPEVNSAAQAAATSGTQAAGTANSSLSGTTNSAVNTSGSVTNGTSATAADAVNSSLAGSATVQGDVSKTNRNNLNSNGGANASVNSQINGLATGAELTSDAAAALSPADTIRDIRGATQSSRDTLYTQVNGKIEQTGRVVSDLNRQARELKGDAKTQFKAAADDLRDREKSLKRSLNDVRKASNDKWADAQARLADDYEAYATAVARAQAAASVNGTSSVTR